MGIISQYIHPPCTVTMWNGWHILYFHDRFLPGGNLLSEMETESWRRQYYLNNDDFRIGHGRTVALHVWVSPKLRIPF